MSDAAPVSSSALSFSRGPVVAVVDPEAGARTELRGILESEGYRVVELTRGRHLLRHDEPPLDAVCLAMRPDQEIDGLEVLRRLQARHPELPVVMIATDARLDAAVAAMKAGAYDCLTHPVAPDRLRQTIRRACQLYALHKEIRALQQRHRTTAADELVGDSPAMREIDRQIERVLDSDVTVCVLGASGTGKELVARAIHQRGQRAAGPFVAINCAAVPSSLQESELFGHEKGAFTGAIGSHHGRFEQAHGGTLFLDELGEMSPATQAALLRTLQERTVRRVGGSCDIPVDVRIVGATHRDLEAEVQAGRFREDLYYRLVVYPIELPSLAKRKSDIPALVAHFIRQLNDDVPEKIHGVSADALDALVAYDWPGNVRELRNVIHRAMLATARQEVGVGDLPSEVRRIVLPSLPPSISMAPMASIAPASDRQPPMEDDDLVLPLADLERREILKALRVTEGSVPKAAELLGIGRATLYRRLAKLELEASDFAQDG